MSNKKYASPLRFQVKPSRRLILAVIAPHVCAMGVLAITEIPWYVLLLLACAIVVSLWMFLALNGITPALKAVERLLPRIHEAIWESDNNWTLTTSYGEEIKAKLLATSFVHPHLTVVNLKLSRKPWYSRYRSLILLRDNLDAETFRRLRVRLRWYSSPEQDNWAALK